MDKNNLLCSSSSSISFSKLVGEYSPLIRKISHSITTSKGKNDDLFQEGLIGLYCAFLTYDGVSSAFTTYASVCIKRRMISWLKKTQRQYIPLLEDFIENEPAAVCSDPEKEFFTKDFCYSFHEKAKNVLSAYEYSVLLLYLKGFSANEIAEKLSYSVKSVENALYRLKQKLRTAFV